MSTYEEINKKLVDGALFQIVPPRRPPGKVLRRVTVTKEIHRRLKYPDRREKRRLIAFRAHMTFFETGPQVSGKQLWRLDDRKERGVWELRSYKVEPQMRLFGHFAAMNDFVGLSLCYRDDVGFDAEILRVIRYWRELFPNLSPMTTKNVHKLFVGAMENERYFN